MRARFSLKPSMGVALLALALSFTGGARAIVNQITGADFKPHSITGTDLRSRSITSAILARGAVVQRDIGAGQVQTDDFDDGAVSTDNLADGAVTAEKLSNVSARALAPGSVTGDALAPGAISGKLQLHAIGSAQLAPEEPITYVGESTGPPWLNGAADPMNGVSGSETPLGKAGFYKDNSGDVHLVGSYVGPTGGPAFILPPGYRPSADLTIGDRAVDAVDVLEIRADGEVAALTQAETNTIADLQVVDLPDQILLQGISWRPDQSGVGGG
jgi:hypothetical protein